MDPLETTRLTEKEYKRLSRYIETEVGIKMPPTKKVLIETRLQKRLRKLGLNDFTSYCDHVFKNQQLDNELTEMIDAITTNKTDFMREPAHFEYMVHQALPKVLTHLRRPVKLWSVACSTGQEPYNLAMFMEEFNRDGSSLDFSVLATDINSSVLDKGRKAIYSMKDIETVSQHFRKSYFLKSKKAHSDQITIKPHIKKRVHFQKINLMNDSYGIKDKFDIVFCRNVLIYFDKETQQRVLKKIINHMNMEAYLFLGHSEGMAGTGLGLESVASSIYRRVR